MIIIIEVIDSAEGKMKKLMEKKEISLRI